MIQNEIVAVLGKKGSGKSRWVKSWIARQRHPVVVWDRLDEYHADGARASDPVPGAIRFWEDEHATGFSRLVATLLETGQLPRVSVVVASPRDFDRFCRWAFRRGSLAVVIEEADSYMSPNKLPEALGDLIRRGRHTGVDQVYVSRVPSEFHRDVTRNCDLEVYFTIQEAIDLEWIRKRAGENFVDTVRKLKPRTCVERRP